MERTIVVLLVISVCLAQCASVKGKDPRAHEPSHIRGKRCDVCNDAGPPHHGPHHPFGPPPPPPPPPFFRALQYSGLARSNDGGQEVFSGAAAAADLNNQAAGQAYSVASSSAGAGSYGGRRGQLGYGQQGQSQSSGYSSQSVQQTTGQSNGFGGQSAQQLDGQSSSFGGQAAQQSAGQSNGFNGQSSGQLNGFDGQTAPQSSFNGQSSGQSNGYGGQSSNLQSQSARGEAGLSSTNSASQSRNGGVGYGQKILGSGSFKESHYSFQSGGNKHFDSHGEANGGFNAGQGSENQALSSAQAYGAGLQQEQHVNSVGFGHGYGDGPKSGKQELLQSENQQPIQSSSNGQWQQEHYSNHGSGSQNLQQAQSSGSGQWHQGNTATGGQSSSFGASKSNYGSGAELGHQESNGGQSALSGALGLASQGLQAAQQTQPGCSTCGSGSYALSNAKSKTGDAVAVSIGG